MTLWCCLTARLRHVMTDWQRGELGGRMEPPQVRHQRQALRLRAAAQASWATLPDAALDAWPRSVLPASCVRPSVTFLPRKLSL